jgi:uncharacterized membrane protein YdjX (TVP38/TMEM64 family)
METAAGPEGSSADQPSSRTLWLRLGALGVVTVGLIVLSSVSGLGKELKPDAFRAHVLAAGSWGPLLLLVAFAVGELVHVPGVVFVGAAVLAYGRPLGGLLAYVGAIVSLAVSFAVVRGIGGKPLGAIKWAFARRLLGQLDTHPLRTVVLLRSVLWMTPQLNYALALSNLRFRDYLLGSAAGLVLPIVALSYVFAWFLK